MSFYLYFLCGILGGVLGGMGMGGGTVLIPLLTIFCGVEQGAAQGVNLLSFLPMSLLAAHLPAVVLKKGFGVFLIVLSFFQFSSAIRYFQARKQEKAAAK